jgi:hypothetical protein
VWFAILKMYCKAQLKIETIACSLRQEHHQFFGSTTRI